MLGAEGDASQAGVRIAPLSAARGPSTAHDPPTTHGPPRNADLTHFLFDPNSFFISEVRVSFLLFYFDSTVLRAHNDVCFGGT